MSPSTPASLALWCLLPGLALPAAPFTLAIPRVNLGHWQKIETVTGKVTVDGKPRLGRGRLLVYLPRGYDPREARSWPLLVALHGWNHPAEFWRDKSDIAWLADRYGVVVACPDLGKSIFETRFFPESKPWGPVPGTPWLLQAVLPHLRATYKVRQDAQGTGILGYSTGGRGALMAVQHGGAFSFCGSISGTYDLPSLAPRTGEYKIHAHVYGERAQFPRRWAQESSLDDAFLPAYRNTYLFVAHGGHDRVVDPAQARSMKAFMDRHHLPGRVLDNPAAGHDWAFWNESLPAAFEAMDLCFRGVGR